MLPFYRNAHSKRSSALLITLTIVALVTILVIAFLGLASQDLKSTYFYVRSDQTDQIARAGLDFVVGNLEGEIQDASFSNTNFGTVQSPFYVPLTPQNNYPMRMVTLGSGSTNILIVSSTGNFYTGGQSPSINGSAIASTNASLNNQVITASDWNKPMLVPPSQLASLPIPSWVFLTRTGPISVSSSTVSSTVGPSLANPTAVIGRYAFVVYDVSGLLDINVAGYDSGQTAMMTNVPGKGILPYADLTQLPGINSADVNALVQFRNSISETNFPLALANTNGFGLLTNGFMKVYAVSTNGPSDTTFLSRQEFIQYAKNNTDWTNALPYLTTFSREINGPTWGPTTNMGTINGVNFNYLTLANNSTTATSATTYNPNVYAVRVPAAWAGAGTRNNGQPWIAGDPLAKYRFPLSKLALLESVGTTYSYSDWLANTDNIQTNIQKYFGLDLVSDSNGLYRHWQYPTISTTYLHTDGNILSLAQVAALATPREPDFFELLQAGILNGSLGDWGRGDASQGPADFDSKTTIQLLRIGANIIDQWKADNYPIIISYLQDAAGDSFDVYGVADLPYVTQMFVKGYSPNSPGPGPPSVPVYPYIYFQVWNPHQAPSTYNSANYPAALRIVPYYYNNASNPTKKVAFSDSFTEGILDTPAGFSSGAFKWFYNPTLGYSASSGGTNLFAISTTYGGGLETDSTAGLFYKTPINFQTSYREPGLMVGSPNPGVNGPAGAGAWSPGSSLGGGSPSGALAAISLPEIPSLPATTILSNAHPNNPSATTNIFWNTGFGTTNSWKVNLAGFAVFAQQYKDQSGTWRTYGTFEGMDSQAGSTILPAYTGWNYSTFAVSTGGSTPNDQSFPKTDPRTFRFGPGNIAPVTGSANTVTYQTPNAANPPLLSPALTAGSTNNIAWIITGNTPFTNSGSSASAPFRMDYWAVNNPNNPIQGAYYAGTQTPVMADVDGGARGGDSAYAYSTGTSAWGGNPEVPGTSFSSVALPARPVMLNHPFHSVGDLGYVYRDDPWRTLDFMTPGSADAGLLDLFTVSEASVVAGRINPNTPYPQVIQSLVSGSTQSSVTGVTGAAATVTSANAQSAAQGLVTLTAATPAGNRAALVTSGAVSNIINSGYFTDNGAKSLVKTEGESLVRAMAESSNTRTWNLLIDVVGQSGHFVNNSALVTSGGRDNFVVEGERHYWLHIAIDRYTGKIVDQQLELVDQ
jgi:hypothetical protein